VTRETVLDAEATTLTGVKNNATSFLAAFEIPPHWGAWRNSKVTDSRLDMQKYEN
jgi:hypothetical protein